MNLKAILALPTPRLLAYYKKYYRSRQNPYILYYNSDPLPEDKLKSDRWHDTQQTIKFELDTREHVA